MYQSKLSLLVALSLGLAACGQQAEAPKEAVPEAKPAAAERVVHVYNWSDYIAEDTIANFTKETGIKVVYDVFDSNEVLEAKLLSGSTGYDIVVPSLSFLGRQVQAGVFMPIDKSKLKNYGNLDAGIMARIAEVDPENSHSVPYLMGTTGIGYNAGKVKAVLGEDAPLDSWDLVFKPENISKLHSCGVAMLDTPQELLPIALNYLGEDPNSFDEAVIEKGAALLESIRPHITYFHSSQYINDLANGDVCLAVGWSGDIFQARDRAADAENGVEVSYVIPKEGAPMFFDMMAIPKDAKHVDEAYAFIDYVLRPEVIAAVQDYVSYGSANTGAFDLVDESLRNNPGVFPSDETRQKLFTFAVLPPEVDRLQTRIWTRLKTGK
ncbi:extracellular solute-binding protein [Pseudomarimonas arenosa]|uniref:Putrescine-binding periplasmic protein n=1 Tax=Pseudomarimonas arenosa TaxID=2774145 RepID=A0AAW3ZP91_9GAMM|nr:extracellular solute-binding protein [Pseudomarimonas arenosa]MBD8527773.1 extracellular solute-binding protein [Pseudomarimonas arenosa]